MSRLAVRCRLMIALCALALLTFSLAGCNGGDSATPQPPVAGEPGGGDGNGGGDPNPSPAGALTGASEDPAVAAVTDLYTGPVSADDIDETGILLSRIMVQFRRGATVGEVNAAIAAVDGEIAFSRADSLAMDITVPRAQDFEALEALLDLLESQPGVIAATWDAQAQVEILPRDFSGRPVDPDTLRHLLPTRFPAAWNAAGRLTDTNCDRPLRIIMPDAFAPAEPAFFLAQVAPELFVPDEANRPSRFSLETDERDHGYLVALTMLARHDERTSTGALPVNVAPGASCVRVEAIEKSGLGSTDLAVRLSERLGTPDSNVIVQVSLGFGLPPCGRGDLLEGLKNCTGQFTGLTQERLERTLMHRIETTLRWAAVGISEAVTRHALFVMAAGNEHNKPVGILYPGFGDARFGYYPQMLASLLELDRDFGSGDGIPAAVLWEPSTAAATAAGFTPPAELTRITLSEDYLAEKRIEFAELEARQRAPQALDATLVVGATGLPAFDASRTDASDVARSAFSNTIRDARGIVAVGEGVSMGVVRRNADGVETDRVNGTSFAAPQVSGLAAYLWLLSPELRALPAAETLRHIVENAQTSEGTFPTAVIDAYAAVLALDQFDDDRPIRQAILDVNGDGRFDDRDIELYLEAFEASREASFNLSTDFSRFDLNGDGRTGGARTVPMDLDGFTFDGFGRALLSERVTMRIEGVEVTLNEFAVSDIQALCFFAYESLGLYRGTPQRRSELLGAARCAPVELSIIFPERFTGETILDVLATLPVIGPMGTTVQQPVADLLLRFSPTCASVSDQELRTNEAGRANVRVTPEPDCDSVSVQVDALDSDGGIIVSETVTANIRVSVLSVSPEAVSLASRESTQFAAILNGVTTSQVNWQATGGTIDSTGRYTAGDQSGTFAVQARLISDTSVVASATVSVANPLNFSGGSLQVAHNFSRFSQQVNVEARVFRFPEDTAVEWQELRLGGPLAATYAGSVVLEQGTCTFDPNGAGPGQSSLLCDATLTYPFQTGVDISAGSLAVMMSFCATNTAGQPYFNSLGPRCASATIPVGFEW
jgi:hypothetical protein